MNVFFKKLFPVILFLGFIASVKAQQKDNFSFTLQQAIDYAVQNQAAVQNASLDAEIAHQKVHELTGAGLPQIKGSIDAKKFIEIPTQVIPVSAFGGPKGVISTAQFGLEYQASAGLEASQLVFDGSYLVGLQASRTYEELARKNYQQSKIEAASLVSKAYYGVLVNEERMKLLNANVVRVKKLRDDTKAFFDNGFVEKIDFDRIELTYNNILTEKDKTERLIKLSYDLLKYQMGMDLNADLTLADKLENTTLDEALPTNDGIDVSKRIEYGILETTQHLQQLDLKKNRFEYLPSLVLYAGISTYAYRFNFDFLDHTRKWYPTELVGATLSVPVFDGMQKRARISQSKLNLKKFENSFHSLKQGLTMEAESAKTNLINSISSLQTQKKNRELATEVSSVSKIKYDQGVGSNLEVVNAETSLKEAETNYYSALYDALIAKIDFAKATGALLK